MEYTLEHFIRKFEAIPEELWRTGSEGFGDGEQKCALGFCRRGETYFGYGSLSEEGKSLVRLLTSNNATYYDSAVVWSVNDNLDLRYQQPTPKQRILARLKDAKAEQKPKEIIRYVAVSENIKEKELVLN